MNVLHAVRIGGLDVIVNDILPAATMIVSRDVFDSMKKLENKPVTLEGEVVREAKRQLETGDDEAT